MLRIYACNSIFGQMDAVNKNNGRHCILKYQLKCFSVTSSDWFFNYLELWDIK